MIAKLNSSVPTHSALKSEQKPTNTTTALKNESVNQKQSRIERISSEIANGTYKLDMSKTAKAILDSLS